jgi:hypothetical protein
VDNVNHQPPTETAQPSWLNDMVRIGGDRAITETPNWSAMTHEQLYDAVVTNNDPGAVYRASADWIDLGNRMLTSSDTLHQQIVETESGWQGEAADSARAAITQLVGWSGKAAQTAQFMGHQLNQQGDVLATAKASMPAPSNFELAQAAATQPGLAGMNASLTDLRTQQQAAQESHAQAIAVANAMTVGSQQIDQSTPEFEPVPIVLHKASPMLQGSPAMSQPAGQGLGSTPASPMINGASPVAQSTQTRTQSAETPVAAAPHQPGVAASGGSPAQWGGSGNNGPAWAAASPPMPSQGTTSSGYVPPSGVNYSSGSPGYSPANTVPSGYAPSGYAPANTTPSAYVPPSTMPSNSGPGPFGWSPSSTGFGPGVANQPGGSQPNAGNSWLPGGTGDPEMIPEGVPTGGLPRGGGLTGLTGGGGVGPSGVGAGPASAAKAGMASEKALADEESVGGVRGGSIADRLGGGTGSGAGKPGMSAAETEEAATAGGRSSGSLPAGAGTRKRGEDDKEHKSAGYLKGEQIFEPLGGELPPAVIGERRPKKQS